MDRIRYENVVIYRHQAGLILEAQEAKTGHAKLVVLGFGPETRLGNLVKDVLSFKNHQEAKKHLKAHFEVEFRFSTFGVLGFTRFLEGFYLLYIKERSLVAEIGCHRIFEIRDVGILPVFERSKDRRE